MKGADLTAEEQTAILATRYSLRAEAYDELWSPVIRPVGERLIGHLPLRGSKNIIDVGAGAGALLAGIQRAAPNANILGVDRSEGMLRLARKRHSGPLALMDVQNLAVSDNRFDAALVAFVLFQLPHPERCLDEVRRVLKPGGTVGTVTWGAVKVLPANKIWDEELKAAGARVHELPAAANRACCDSQEKVTALLEQTGFISTRVWSESLEYRWRPEDHFEYQTRSFSSLLLESLGAPERETCLRRVRDRLSDLHDDQYIYQGEVVMATARKAANAGERTLGVNDG
jgi:ubiquinone/menaquinone biosynthesis C-methylase UbiE